MITDGAAYIIVTGGDFYSPLTLDDIANSASISAYVSTTSDNLYNKVTVSKDMHIGTDDGDETFFRFRIYDWLVMSGADLKLYNYVLNADGFETYMSNTYAGTKPIPTSLAKKAGKNLIDVKCEPYDMLFDAASGQFVVNTGTGVSGGAGNGGVYGNLKLLNQPKIKMIPRTS